MSVETLRKAKWTCVAALVALFAFHLWSDGQNINRSRELRKAGVPQETIWEQAPFLCGKLNVAAIVLMVAAGALDVIHRRAKREEEKNVGADTRA